MARDAALGNRSTVAGALFPCASLAQTPSKSSTNVLVQKDWLEKLHIASSFAASWDTSSVAAVEIALRTLRHHARLDRGYLVDPSLLRAQDLRIPKPTLSSRASGYSVPK